MSSETSRGGIAVLDWLRGYQGEWLRLDLVAGLTTAAVVIPKAMAYATVAGLPVEVGLYTAFVPMVIYADPGDLAAAQREHHHHAGDPHRDPARPGRARRRSGGAADRLRDPRRPGRDHADPGLGAAPGGGRQLHLGAGADRLQGGDRAGHRPRPGAEAARHPLRQGRLPAEPARAHPPPAGDLARDPGGRRRHAAHPGRDRALRPRAPRRRWSPSRSASPPRACSRSRPTAWRPSATSPRACRPSRRRASPWSSSSGPARSASR